MIGLGLIYAHPQCRARSDPLHHRAEAGSRAGLLSEALVLVEERFDYARSGTSDEYYMHLYVSPFERSDVFLRSTATLAWSHKPRADRHGQLDLAGP
jgi:hypothetical protein